MEITPCSEGAVSHVNGSDISSVDRQDVAAAPPLAVAGPQPDPKVIALAVPVSQSGSNNTDVDDESPTSALILQLEPADHHRRQKQPSAQQASTKAEQAPVSTLHSAGSEVSSAQQLSTAAEQKLADADSAQPMTDDQLPTNLPAAATEQEHVDSEPVQNAASEDFLTQQADFAAGPVTDEQGEHQHIKQHNAQLCDVCLSTRIPTPVCQSVCLSFCLSVCQSYCHGLYAIILFALAGLLSVHNRLCAQRLSECKQDKLWLSLAPFVDCASCYMFGTTDTIRDSTSHANVVFGLLQEMTQPQQVLMQVKHHQTLKSRMAQSSQVHKQQALAIACLDMQPSPSACTMHAQLFNMPSHSSDTTAEQALRCTQ